MGISAGPRAPDEVRAIISFILGAVSLSYAAGLLSGWVQAPMLDRTGACDRERSTQRRCAEGV